MLDDGIDFEKKLIRCDKPIDINGHLVAALALHRPAKAIRREVQGYVVQ